MNPYKSIWYRQEPLGKKRKKKKKKKDGEEAEGESAEQSTGAHHLQKDIQMAKEPTGS